MPLGTDWLVHVPPPLVVPMMAELPDVVVPTAQHVAAVGHETP
jgi:hypothetical protein